MLAKGQITVTNLDDGKTPFLHQAYKMKDGRFLKHYPVYEAPPVNGYKEGDLWYWNGEDYPGSDWTPWSGVQEDLTGVKQSGYFIANKSNATFDFNDWTFYADELSYSDTDKFYPKFEGTYSDYNGVASDDQTKYTWKIIKADDGIGIKSVKEYYAVSTSNATSPTSWSGTYVPTTVTNKYLWNYEVYIYSDGSTKETEKRVIGTHGATGNGITSVTNYYLATTLATGVTTATSGWETTVQTTDSVKKYLWNYEEVLYTNGTKTPTTPVIIGTHGEKGDRGASGQNGIVGLLTNESITLPANNGGLVSTYTGATGVFDIYDGITKKTGTGIVYSIASQSNITVTINSTTGAYSVTAMPTGTTVLNGFAVFRAVYNGITIEKQLSVAKALTGATGSAGVGLKNTVIQYASSTSGTTAPTTGWKTDVPTVAAGNYLWTKNTWTYTDNTTEVSYSVSRIGADGNTGKDGIAGKDGVGIKSTVITYGQSTNGSSYAGVTWTSTIPTVTPGNFLWTKTVWTYTDNTSETGYSVARSGTDGASGKDGIAGKDGKGISSTTITYGLSTTDTVEPTKYTSNVPTLVKGQYLWTKTVWKYTDTTTETGYTKTYIAKDGNNGSNGIAGKDGVGISKTTITYAKSTNGTTAPTTGYTTTVPSTNPGDYLWTKTVWTYTDNTNETGYSVGKIGNTGATGDSGKDGIAGKDGKGIKSTVIDYATSANGTTKPATGWGPTVPSLTKGQYLWTRTIWTYTDSATETGYSVSYIAKDGNNGTDGIAGKDGVGIKNTTFKYGVSTSGKTKPSNWSTTVPTVPEGQFLWTETTWTYTDSTSEKGYSVAKQGAKGPQGDKGQSGLDTYLHKAYSWSADGTDRFTTIYPQENLQTGSNTEFILKNEAGGGSQKELPFNILSDDIIGKKVILSVEVEGRNMTNRTGTSRIGYELFTPRTDGKTTWLGLWETVNNISNLSAKRVELAIAVPTNLVLGQKLNGKLYIQVNGEYIRVAYPKFEIVNDDNTGATIYTPSPKDDYENAYPKYEGYYSSHNPVQSTNPSDYTWSIIRGENGLDTYIHKAWSWSADGADRFTDKYPNENLIVREKIKSYTSYNESITFDSKGTLKTIVGGANPLNHFTIALEGTIPTGIHTLTGVIKYDGVPLKKSDLLLRASTYNARENSDIFQVSDDGTFRITENWNRDSRWIFHTQTGITLEKGKVIEIENFKFEKSSEPTIYAPSPQDDYENAYPTFFGTYSSHDKVQSQNPKDYTWSRILGESGKDGENGKDSKTYTAYSWSADGSDRFTDKYPNENLMRRNKSSNVPFLDGAKFSINVEYEVKDDGLLVLKNTKANKDAYYRLSSGQNPESITEGKDYVLSGEWINISKTTKLIVRAIAINKLTGNYVNIAKDVFKNEGMFKLPFKYFMADGIKGLHLSIDIVNENGAESNSTKDVLAINNLKMEEATQPTIYTPSPQEDFNNAYPPFEGYYSTVSNEPQSQNPDDYVWSRFLGGSTNVFHAWANSPDGVKDFSINPATINLFSLKEFNIRKTHLVSNAVFYIQSMAIKGKPNTKYTASSRMEKRSDGGCSAFISTNNTASSGVNDLNGQPRTITTGSDGVFYIAIDDKVVVNTTDQWVQIVEGDTDKPYMPSALDDEGRASYSYMGVQVKVSDIQSTDPKDYKWTKVNGDDNTVVGSKNLFLPTDVYIEGTPNNIASSELGFYSTNLVSNTDNLWIKISNSDNSYFNANNIGEKRTFSFKYQLNEGEVVSLGGDLSPFESYKIYVDNILISEDILANPVPINTDKMIHKISISGIVKDLKNLPSAGNIFIRPNQKEGYPHKYNIDLFDFQIEEGEKATGFAPSYLLNMTQAQWEERQKEIEDKLGDKADADDMIELGNLITQLNNSYQAFVSDGGKYEEDLKNLEDRTIGWAKELGDQVGVLNFIKTYMKVGEEGLTIGKDGDPMKMLLGSGRLSFMDGGKEVAYFSNQSFFINRGAIVESLQIGVHKLSKIGETGTIFQYVGKPQ